MGLTRALAPGQGEPELGTGGRAEGQASSPGGQYRRRHGASPLGSTSSFWGANSLERKGPLPHSLPP